MTVQPPFKYDVVGSFLRPDYLKKAREEFANKTIDAKQLKAIEDKAIQELVAKEKEVGLQAVFLVSTITVIVLSILSDTTVPRYTLRAFLSIRYVLPTLDQRFHALSIQF